MSRHGTPPGICLVLTLLFSSSGFSHAQTPAPTGENEELNRKIFDAWKSRQDRLKSVHVEWKCTTTIHEGFYTAYSEGRFKPKTNEPPRDYLCPGEGWLRMNGPDLSASLKNQRWNPFGKVPENYECAESIRDEAVRLLHDPGHPGCDHPIAVVGAVRDSKIISNGMMLPLLIHLRGAEPPYKQILTIARWEPTGRTVNVGTRPCVEMTRKTPEKGISYLMYLDPKREYVPLRFVTTNNNKPTWQWSAEYTPDAKVGWMIQSWEYSSRPNGVAMSDSGRYAVTRYEIGSDAMIEDAVFPAGTVVKDYSRGHEFQYVVRDDGAATREFSPGTTMTYEEMKSLPPRSNGWAYLWMSLAAVTFVGSVGGWIWVRAKRTSK